jgi:hypothetical protein
VNLKQGASSNKSGTVSEIGDVVLPDFEGIKSYVFVYWVKA